MTERDLTPLLEKAAEGDARALDEVARLVHDDLTRMARRMVPRGGAGGRPWTLEPASLVNETFIKLLQQRTQYRDREHFFAIATKVMLRVLLDYKKSRRRQKRGPDRIQVSLGALERRGAGSGTGAVTGTVTEVSELVEALEKLAELDPRVAKVVKLRALWGLAPKEVAEVLGVSRSTADRDWRFARVWLAAHLRGGEPPTPA